MVAPDQMSEDDQSNYMSSWEGPERLYQISSQSIL